MFNLDKERKIKEILFFVIYWFQVIEYPKYLFSSCLKSQSRRRVVADSYLKMGASLVNSRGLLNLPLVAILRISHATILHQECSPLSLFFSFFRGFHTSFALYNA